MKKKKNTGWKSLSQEDKEEIKIKAAGESYFATCKRDDEGHCFRGQRRF